MTLKKYRVLVSYVSYCDAEIEASNEEEAHQIALNMDGGDFTPQGGDDWSVDSVEEIE